MFRSSYYADISLNQWMALVPPELVDAHLKLDERTRKPAQGQAVIVASRDDARP